MTSAVYCYHSFYMNRVPMFCYLYARQVNQTFIRTPLHLTANVLSAELAGITIYSEPVLFEQSNCIDWIKFYYILSLSKI